MIKYIKGNLFDYIKDKQNIIVPHLCNVYGSFGAGFALEVARKYPLSTKIYSEHCKRHKLHDYNYYSPSTLFTEENFGHFAHMICQLTLGGQHKNFYYKDLVVCMESVVDKCANLDIQEIYTVKFGSGLANGSWGFIEELIREIWEGFSVNVFYL